METTKKENPEARRWLDKIPSHQWALAHDDGRRYEIMTIMRDHFFESFWSLGLPVTAAVLLLFDELGLQSRQGICDSRGRLNCGEMYTKPVMDKFEEFRTGSVTYIIMPLDDNAFQVTQPLQKNGWIVQLKDSSCTCGGFQFVDDCYSVEELNRTYAATFNSIPEISAWQETSGVPTMFPPVIPPLRPPTNVSGKYKQKTTPRTILKKKSSIFL
ncbi:unnamed protein product [Arabis nemorensis]|uniref:Uncharacterized protein n=1 Tax=Arabis nemorensis TaxID=586526 RepID=A0A565BD63_9BRAS|nr:unnamed protein product [Arabis nemorensis]